MYEQKWSFESNEDQRTEANFDDKLNEVTLAREARVPENLRRVQFSDLLKEGGAKWKWVSKLTTTSRDEQLFQIGIEVVLGFQKTIRNILVKHSITHKMHFFLQGGGESQEMPVPMEHLRNSWNLILKKKHRTEETNSSATRQDKPRASPSWSEFSINQSCLWVGWGFFQLRTVKVGELYLIDGDC